MLILDVHCENTRKPEKISLREGRYKNEEGLFSLRNIGAPEKKLGCFPDEVAREETPWDRRPSPLQCANNGVTPEAKAA